MRVRVVLGELVCPGSEPGGGDQDAFGGAAVGDHAVEVADGAGRHGGPVPLDLDDYLAAGDRVRIFGEHVHASVAATFRGQHGEPAGLE
jgi:hypothetical protein